MLSTTMGLFIFRVSVNTLLNNGSERTEMSWWKKKNKIPEVLGICFWNLQRISAYVISHLPAISYLKHFYAVIC